MASESSAFRLKVSLRDPLILGAAIAAAFGPLLWAPFIYDDIRFILNNHFVIGPWPGWTTLLTQPIDATQAYEPLATIEHRLLYILSGDIVWPYRLSSLLLHWVNAILFLFICRRRLRNSVLALAAALLFALYPAQVEVLAVSTFKTHLTAALMTLLALLLLELPRWESPVRLTCLWLIFAVGLFAKETVLLIPTLSLACLACQDHLGRTLKKAAPLYFGWVAIAAAYLALRFYWVPRRLAQVAGESLMASSLTAAKLLLWYLGQLVLPLGLCFEHSIHGVGQALALEGLPVAAGVLCALAALAALSRRDQAMAYAAAWILIALAPFLNLIAFLNLSLVSDRYLYLASAGFALLAVRSTELLFTRIKPRRLALSLGLVAAAYAAQDVKRAAYFVEPLELWRQTAACAPENPRAHAALGSFDYDHRLYAQAAAEFRQALALKPDYWEAMQDLPGAYAAMGRRPEALAWAKRRVAARPDASGWLALGAVLLEDGKPAEALGPLELAVRLEPTFDEAHLRLGQTAVALKRWDQASGELSIALQSPRLRLNALEALADLRAARKDAHSAEALYAQVLRENHLQTQAVAKLARLRMARGDRAGALRLYDELLATLDAALAQGRSRARADDQGLLDELEKTCSEARRGRELMARQSR